MGCGVNDRAAGERRGDNMRLPRGEQVRTQTVTLHPLLYYRPTEEHWLIILIESLIRCKVCL